MVGVLIKYIYVLLRCLIGKYIQIGEDDDKDKVTHSLPFWINESIGFDEIIEFIKLPKRICFHPNNGNPVSIMLDSNKFGLYVYVEGYDAVKHPLRSTTNVNGTQYDSGKFSAVLLYL